MISNKVLCCKGRASVLVFVTAVQKQIETSVLNIVRPVMMENTAVPVDTAMLFF